MKVKAVTSPGSRTLVLAHWWNQRGFHPSHLPRGAGVTCVLAAAGKNAAALKSFASLLNMRLTGQHCEPGWLFQFSMIFTASLKYFQKNRNTLRKATELCWLLANLYAVTWTMLFAFISSTPVMSKLFTCDEMITFLKPCQRRLLLYKIWMWYVQNGRQLLRQYNKHEGRALRCCAAFVLWGLVN